MSTRFPVNGGGFATDTEPAKVTAADLPTSVGTTSSTAQTYYVQTGSGSDSNDGLSWGRALATITAALTKTRAAGGGTIRVGPGTYVPPSTPGGGDPAGGFVVGSNTAIFMHPDTVIQVAAGPGVDQIGFRNSSWGWSGDDSPYIGNDNIRLQGGTVDVTAPASAESNDGILFAGVTNSIINGVKILGGSFCIALVTANARVGCANVKIRNNWLYPQSGRTTYAVAVTDCLAAQITGNHIYCPLSGVGGSIDFEPNNVDDRVDGAIVSGNFIYGKGDIETQGSASDRTRLSGISITDNTFVGIAQVFASFPGMTIKGNRFYGDFTTSTGAVAVTVSPAGPASTYIPDGSVVADNTIRNYLGSNTLPMIRWVAARYGVVAGNTIMDEGLTPPGGPIAAIREEANSFPYIVSGATSTPGSGMHIVVAAGVIGKGTIAGGGTQALAGGTATIAAADSTKPRVDLIEASTVDGSLTVVQGAYITQPPSPAPFRAPAGPNLDANSVAVAYVNVAAAQTSFAQTDIRDMRQLATDHNVFGPNTIQGANWASPSTVLVGPNSQQVDSSVSGIAADAVTSKGDLLAANATPALKRLAVGSDGKVLTADSTQATGLAWTTPSAGGGAAPWANWMPASGKIETIPRAFVRDQVSAALTSGQLRLQALSQPLKAGVAYSSITFLTATQGIAGGTHQWFCLVKASDHTVLRATTDDTSTAWAANTLKTLNLSSAYTPGVDTDVYVGILVVASTMPYLMGITHGYIVNSFSPVLNSDSSGSLTTPLADGTSVTAPSAGNADADTFYVVVS